MLKLKYLFENYDLAKAALENWTHDTDSLDRLLAQFRISSNAIYPFSQNGAIRFLRLAPTAEKRKDNILGELEFLDYLHQSGYPALTVVPAHSGEKVLTLSTKWGEYYASVFARVPGERLDKTDLNDGIVFAYGRSLARLHTLSARYQPKTKKWTHREALDWIEDVLRDYSAPAAVSAASKRLRAALAAIPETPDRYGLVHYDFELDNVFYDSGTNSCAAIDFDDGMYHYYAVDVEQALDSLGEELAGEALENARRVFLTGYRSEREYTAETDALRPLMRVFCTLYAYARLIRSVAEVFPDEPDWLISLRGKLDCAIQNKQRDLIEYGVG